MKFANRYLLLVAFLVLALVAVACGGNTASDLENAAEDVATDVAEEPAPEEPAEEPAPEEPAEEPAEEPMEEPTEEPAAEEPTEEPAAEEPTEEPSGDFLILEDPDCQGQFRRIQAMDEHTVEFELCNSDPAFLSKIAFTPFAIYPQEYLESTGGSGDLLESPIGTGPYMLETWNRGDSIIFTRNPNYWGEPAIAETLVFRWSSEAAARLHGTPGDLETVIRARVLEPLGLASATFNPLRHGNERTSIAPTEFDADWRGRRCWGEVHDENACGLGGVAGHAGLFAAARDVAALGAAWLEADPRLGIAPDLVREATRQHAASDSVRRGLGWLLKSDDDSSAGALFSPASFGHTGFTGTSLWIDPERRLVVACLTNRVYRGRHFTGILAFRRALHDAIAREVDHA